jgi:hypothetical protein
MLIQPSRVLAQGLVAGVIGYLVVVIAYAALDLIGSQPAFATVTHLAALLRSPPAPGAAADTGGILAINGIHLLASLVVGAGASLLINEWEAHPAAGYFIFFVLVAGLIVGSFASAILFVEFARVTGWITILVIDSLAAAAMIGFLFAVHPALRHEIAHMGDM